MKDLLHLKPLSQHGLLRALVVELIAWVLIFGPIFLLLHEYAPAVVELMEFEGWIVLAAFFGAVGRGLTLKPGGLAVFAASAVVFAIIKIFNHLGVHPIESFALLVIIQSISMGLLAGIFRGIFDEVSFETVTVIEPPVSVDRFAHFPDSDQALANEALRSGDLLAWWLFWPKPKWWPWKKRE